MKIKEILIPNYIFDIIIILLFLFFGIRYIRTKQFEDKKNLYTDESKEKAALIAGILHIILAVFWAVMFILKMKGIVRTNIDDAFSYFLPIGILLLAIIVVFIIIYKAVLKKK